MRQFRSPLRRIPWTSPQRGRSVAQATQSRHRNGIDGQARSHEDADFRRSVQPCQLPRGHPHTSRREPEPVLCLTSPVSRGFVYDERAIACAQGRQIAIRSLMLRPILDPVEQFAGPCMARWRRCAQNAECDDELDRSERVSHNEWLSFRPVSWLDSICSMPGLAAKPTIRTYSSRSRVK